MTVSALASPPALLPSVYGLRLHSDVPIPALPLAEGEGADLVIRYGPTPASLPAATERRLRWEAAPNQFLLTVDGVARYFVRDGCEIVVEPAPESSPEAVALFLVGSALGAALHQRGQLALHASAVCVRDRAVLFLGPSGVGKSTLAHALARRGYPLLADDICAVDAPADGPPMVHPGFPHSKLWPDSLAHFALDAEAEALPKVRPELPKRFVPAGERYHAAPAPVGRLYILGRHNEPDIRLVPLKGPARFAMIRRHTYRLHVLNGLGQRPTHFLHGTRLAAYPLSLVRYPEKPIQIDALCDTLEADFARDAD